MKKKLKLLHKQHDFVLKQLKACQDAQFEKWLKLTKIVKEEIIACENRKVES